MNIIRTLDAELQPPGAVEHYYGSLDLEKVIVTTRALGRLGWGAQALALVDRNAVFSCPHCEEPITGVTIGSLHFFCDVELRFDGEQNLANLLSGHRCADDADRDEVR